MKESQAISALGALAQETRLRIVRHLIEAGPDGSPAGAIGKSLDVSSSRLSFHLSNLEHSGLILSRRESRHIIYSANFKQIGGLINYLLTDCCNDHPDIRACCSEPGLKTCC